LGPNAMIEETDMSMEFERNWGVFEKIKKHKKERESLDG